jgi:hypothetical protein
VGGGGWGGRETTVEEPLPLDMNNLTEQDGDPKCVYATSVVEEYSCHLLSPPITIPREPILAKPQRA